MSLAFITCWKCQACAKTSDDFHNLEFAVKLTSFTSRKTGQIILFQPTDDEYRYSYYEATERRAWEAFSDFDLSQVRVIKRSFETGDSHRFDPVFNTMMSFYLEAVCIHCNSIALPVRRWALFEYLQDGFEILSDSDEIAEIIRSTYEDCSDENEERIP